MVQGEVHGVEDSSANEVFVMAAAMNDSGEALFNNLLTGHWAKRGLRACWGAEALGVQTKS